MPRQEYNAEESDKRPYEPEVDEWICDNLKTERNLAKLFAEKIGSCASWQYEVRTHFVSCKRETDIFIEYQCQQGEQIILAFIENKINAGFGKGQPEGYESRARKAEKDEENTTAYTIIFAPKKYMEANNGKGVEVFDKQITYEEAVETLRAEDTQSSRELAKKLQKCIDCPGYIKVVDPDTTATAKLIRKICKEKEFCGLKIREDEDVDKDGDGRRPGKNLWMFFETPEDFGTKFQFVYKAKHRGSVDLQFPNINPESLKKPEWFKKKVDDLLRIEKADGSTSSLFGDLLQIEQTSKSTSIRIGVPCIDSCPPKNQKKEIHKGLRAAVFLQRLLKLCEEEFSDIIKECEGRK